MARTAPTTPGIVPAPHLEARPIPARRNFVGDAIAGLAGAILLTGAGVGIATSETIGRATGQTDAPQPDAELRALCEEFCRLECAVCRLINAAAGPDEEEADRRAAPLVEQQHQLADRIKALPATTIDGLAAKARCAVMFGGATGDGLASIYIPERLLGSLLGDLVGFPIEHEDPAALELRRQFEAREAA